jgi:hypothetical protein
MSFQVSAGINVSEIDLTTIVPAVSTTTGAIGGVFRWGPVEQRVLVDSETALVSNYGKPTNLNAETFLTAASFLGYGNRLVVSRAANTVGTSPVVTVANVEVGKANVQVTSTAALTTGMFVGVVSSDAISIGASVNSIINATHFTLSSNSAALASIGSGTIQFFTNTAFSAIANSGSIANVATQIVKNDADFASKDISSYDADLNFVAKYPGELGNSLKISVCANPNGYLQAISLASNAYYFSNSIVTRTTSVSINVNQSTATFTIDETTNGIAEEANVAVADAATSLYNLLSVTDMLSVGTQNLKIVSKSAPEYALVGGNVSNTSAAKSTFTVSFDDVLKQSSNVTLSSTGSANVLTRVWEYHDTVDSAPGLSEYQSNFGNTAVTSDEMHIVVVDADGKFSGVPGTVLETYRAVSRATDSKTIDGAKNYYKDVINESSKYIYAINDLPGAASATATNLTSSTVGVDYKKFALGRDGATESNIPMTLLASAYDLFRSAEDVDISLVLTGKLPSGSSSQLANYLIDNIAEIRKDCVVFVSPSKEDVVGKTASAAADAIVATRNDIRSTSYAVMDSGYKYMYDRYNDLYRWIPLNGDIAGLCARSDATNDPWWSPAGVNRGQIKNLVRLAYNPSQAERDDLYKAGINPVVTFPGQGTILYGDKTLLSKPSAFDRINVRRLFIVLEKAIARASRTTLFEFNDTFTRSQFKNLITPYLRDVQGRRGITDFLVICDETNNTGEVIDRNEFVGDIYIKPARSINFIQLNFVAVRSGVAFSEVVGQF